MDRSFLWLAALALVAGGALALLWRPAARVSETLASPVPEVADHGEVARAAALTRTPPAGAREHLADGPAAEQQTLSSSAVAPAFAAAALEVRVVTDGDGAPVGGLAVHVVGTNAQRVVGITDEFGVVALTGFAPGIHRISLGDSRYPLVPAIAVDIAPPVSRPPPIVVPPLASVNVRVVDEQGRAVPLATVEGFGIDGGHFEAEADLAGEHLATHLLAGLTRIFARHPDFGRGDRAVEAVPGETREVIVRLRR